MEERTRSELRRDLFASLALLLLALLYGLKAQTIPGSSLVGKGIGAGAVPTGLAVALALFSLILMLRSARGLNRLRRAPAEAPAPLAQRLRPHLRAFGMLVIGAGFVSLLSELGYFVSIALLLAATAWYNGQKDWKKLLAFAVGCALLYDLLFVQLLGITLPPGFWPKLFAPWLGEG